MNSGKTTQKYRIALVNPGKGYYPPLGLAYIASYLRTYSDLPCEIRIFDKSCDPKLVQSVIEFKPRVMGMTVLSSDIFEAFCISREIRALDEGVLQIIGGMHVNTLPEQTLRKSHFDIAVLGEGEETFLEIVKNHYGNGLSGDDLEKIKGIAYLKDGQFNKTEPRPLIRPLDKIPLPARDLLNMKFYNSYYHLVRGLSGNKLASMVGSRGCPYDCIFCSSKTIFKSVRRFSSGYMVSEVRELVERYGVKRIFLMDDTFVVEANHVKNFCELMIAERLNKKVRWEVQGRSNLIKWDKLELLKLMKKAGCYQIDYGFESGCPRVLRILKSGPISIGDHERAMEVTRKAGLKVMGTFILGTPGETETEMMETVSFIERNLKRLDFFDTFIAEPFPGTRLWDICAEKKIVHPDYLTQRENERKRKQVVYTDNVEASTVYGLLRRLDRIAFRKIALSNKVAWFFYNLTHHFSKTISSVRSFISPSNIPGRE
jgi:anaerobic magnesium-protoporphyrin IX monomethyl ester cyclase